MLDDLLERFRRRDRNALARLLTLIARGEHVDTILAGLGAPIRPARVVALTGGGGVGKSTLAGKLMEQARVHGQTVAVLACDPQSPLTGGALLGDRFRMPSRADDDGVFIRSLAAAGGRGAVAEHLGPLIRVCEAFGFDVVLVETVGAGQGDTAVRALADVVVLLLQPETGDDLQWEKAGLLEVADVVVIHKADLPGAERVEAQVLAALALSAGRAPPVLRVSAAPEPASRRCGRRSRPVRRAAPAGTPPTNCCGWPRKRWPGGSWRRGSKATAPCRTCSSAGAAASWTRPRRSRRCCTCWGTAREGGETRLDDRKYTEQRRPRTGPGTTRKPDMIRRFRVLTACMGLASAALLLTGCGPRQARAAGPAAADDTRYEVEATKDVTYRDGDDADKDKHKLDLYLPNGKKDFPVVMFVHGGAWVFGDRNFFGVYEGIGKMFARHGIGAVVISYRLSPHVKHPEHVKDVAAAFAWTHKHIGEYGGRADELFLCGHSAGGHLVSLLATDESYLQAEGLSLKDVKGVMPISGVYGIPDKMFNEVFGKDPEVRKQAGPRNHVHEGCPPFFIVYGDQDYPFCDVASEDFCKALQAKKVSAETLKIKDRNHLDIIGRTTKDDDPCAEALCKFVLAHVKE